MSPESNGHTNTHHDPTAAEIAAAMDKTRAELERQAARIVQAEKMVENCRVLVADHDRMMREAIEICRGIDARASRDATRNSNSTALAGERAKYETLSPPLPPTFFAKPDSITITADQDSASRCTLNSTAAKLAAFPIRNENRNVPELRYGAEIAQIDKIDGGGWGVSVDCAEWFYTPNGRWERRGQMEVQYGWMDPRVAREALESAPPPPNSQPPAEAKGVVDVEPGDTFTLGFGGGAIYQYRNGDCRWIDTTCGVCRNWTDTVRERYSSETDLPSPDAIAKLRSWGYTVTVKGTPCTPTATHPTTDSATNSNGSHGNSNPSPSTNSTIQSSTSSSASTSGGSSSSPSSGSSSSQSGSLASDPDPKPAKFPEPVGPMSRRDFIEKAAHAENRLAFAKRWLAEMIAIKGPKKTIAHIEGYITALELDPSPAPGSLTVSPEKLKKAIESVTNTIVWGEEGPAWTNRWRGYLDALNRLARGDFAPDQKGGGK